MLVKSDLRRDWTEDLFHLLCQQGFAFFLFYVLLNPEVRQLIIAAWEWKGSMVTPFDEHEAIEIEEDKVCALKCLHVLFKKKH